MTAQKGKDLLVKIGDGATPENFTTVAGLRATTLAFNAQSVDITSADSTDLWRELLTGVARGACRYCRSIAWGVSMLILQRATCQSIQTALARAVVHYSARSVSIGSTRRARRTGTTEARSAVAKSNTTERTSDTGSVALTP